jgi:Fe(3+) dicitrate transport protein
MTDVMLKAGLAIGSNQRLGLKYTDYDNDANISYRGLFLDEYRAGADHNPAPDDWFLTGRRSLDLNHEWKLGDNARLDTVVFASETYRDYWRYATNNSASTAAGSWVYADTLNGNNRSFERIGFDSRLGLDHASFGIASEAEIGLRFMAEEMLDQTVAATRATPRTGTLSRDVIDAADSWALYGQNRFILSDRFAVTAGLRAEFYEQRRLDRRLSDAQGNRAQSSHTELMPGVGVTWRLPSTVQLFANVYKAFSPALNGDALNGLEDQELQAERSINIEAGLRGGDGRLSYELTAFRMDFDNQIIPANSASQFQVTNGGKTLHQGFEAGAGAELGGGFNLSGNFTWIPVAEFNGDRFSSTGTLTTPDGNRLPYTPEWIANLSLDYTLGTFRAAVSLHHTAAQYTDVLNTTTLAESTSGFFTGRIGSHVLADLSLTYGFSDQLDLGATVKNLTDKRYIASLRQGVYAGPERSFDVGLRYRF